MPDPLSLFLLAVGKAAGGRAAREGADVLRELLGLQKAQEEMLRQVDVKLDALLEQPYETGRRQLSNALAHWREPDDRQDLLKEARRSFMEAQAHPEPADRSFASMHLAAVWAALDSPQDVRASLHEAHVEALRGATLEVQRGQSQRGILRAGYAKDSPTAPPKACACIALANHIAMARRDWGEPNAAAPIFIGFASIVKKPPSGLRPLEQLRWKLLNFGGWGLAQASAVDYSTIPVEQRPAESDRVVAWMRQIDSYDYGKGTREWKSIQWWLEHEGTATA